MRIHRIHLQHVAGVDDRELVFGDGVTVVVGPNEAGKSTIPEALSLLLEEKDRYDNARIRAVRPVHVDADPTIELECTTGPYHLTYRKVFGATGTRRATELTIHAPSPASLTGDAAHERMLAILEETVDEELWSALRVQQRHDVGQADLSASGALAAALDAAGGGASTLAEDETLVARVDAAAAEFWTATGRERAPLKESAAAVEAVGAQLAEATAALDAVRDATERHDRLVARIDAWQRSLPELQARAKAAAEAQQQVDAERRALHDAERTLEQATTAATRARDAAADRQALAERVARLEEVAADRAQASAAAAEAVVRAEAQVEDARTARDQARSRLEAARRVLRAAEADVRLQRRRDDVARLVERIAEAEALHERREDAKARLDDRAPSAADLRALERLDERVRTTRALLAAGLPQLTVTGPAGAAVELDGTGVGLGDGPVAHRVEAPVTLRIGEVEVAVSPGTSATVLADDHADAVHALRSALESAGVADVGAARARRDAAQQARRDLDQTDTEWQRLTAVDGLDGLRAALVRTREAIDELQAERPDDRPLPDDVAHAERLHAAAQEEAEQLETAATTAQSGLETSLFACESARTAAAEAAALRQAADQQLREATEGLAAARAAAGDDDLVAAVAAADEAVRTATEARDRVATTIAALDVAAIDADAEATRARLEQTRSQLQQAEVDRATLWGTIEASSSAGLGERVPQLAAALDDAAARHDALRRRADALWLLRETLHRHRDEARARYQEPLRAEVERLGRVVFGADFAVELDDDLRVARRTLDGRTLDVEQLSGGAQEQLAIITRLAAARLVDRDDGVPVILDDALGYADPVRTDRVSTLLADVGREAQVIVLTCDPDRFTGVPGAELVTIDAC